MTGRWWWEGNDDGGLGITTDDTGPPFRTPHPPRLTTEGLRAGGECIVGVHDVESWLWYWTMEHDRRALIDRANRRRAGSDPRIPRVLPDPTL